MKAMGNRPRGRRVSLKLILLWGAAAALTAMGVVSVQAASARVGGTSAGTSAIVADPGTVTSPKPPATPTVASAAPPVKATAFNGGGWPGTG